MIEIGTGLEALVAETFSRPHGDPAYGRNYLQPGGLPLEWSFSEAEPSALRFELQPNDPMIAPRERLGRVRRFLREFAREQHGEITAAEFEAALSSPAHQLSSTPSFGAFVGFALGPRQARAVKAYIELDPAATASPELSGLAGVTPHFRSVTVSPDGVAERVYYLCRQGLTLTDLEGVCSAIGLVHRYPALLAGILELTEAQFRLPPQSVMLGVRRSAAAAELKVELVSGLAMEPLALTERVERLLMPSAVFHFRRWRDSLCLSGAPELELSVVSVRVSTLQGVQLSVYAGEPQARA